MKHKVEPATLTYEEAARYLGIEVDALRRRVIRKQVRALRIGHCTVRFRKADLDAYLDSCATVAA